MSSPKEVKQGGSSPFLLRETSDFSRIDDGAFITAVEELGINLQNCPPEHLRTIKEFITARRQIFYGEDGADKALGTWDREHKNDQAFFRDHLGDIQVITRMTNPLSGVNVIAEAQRIVQRKK